MGNKPINNERKACDAVARAIEVLNETERTNAYSPEDTKEPGQVEYAFEIGKTVFAVEHTVVEAFGGQIQADTHFAKFGTPITDALDGKLPPPGVYYLNFRINPSAGMKPKHIEKAQSAIIAWIEKTASELHEECPNQPSKNAKPFGHKNSRGANIEGVELGLVRETHWAISNRHSGRLFATRIAPKDYESLRLERLGEALEDKLPKLQKWKDKGARSVLILENRDLSLSNHVVICEALETELTKRNDVPDEIWLVDTVIETEWTVWCLVRDGVVFPDSEEKSHWDFDPAKLTKVK